MGADRSFAERLAGESWLKPQEVKALVKAHGEGRDLLLTLAA